QMESLVRQTLEALNYYQPQLRVRTVLDRARGLADLRVEVLDEGIRGTVQEIELSGARTNSRQAVLEFLKLKPGMPLRADLVPTISNQLWQSGRFYRQEVRLTPLAEMGDLKLELDLEELQAAPPLHQPFSPEVEALLNFRTWLMDREKRGEDVVLSLT